MTVTYAPPLSGGVTELGASLLMEAVTEGPAYVRSRAATRWHMVRSAIDRYDSFRDEIRRTWYHWCGTFSHGSRAITADEAPAGEPTCGTCYGRALGVNPDRPDLLYTPRTLDPPKRCPGSQTMWVNEKAHNWGLCLVCGDAVKLRGFGTAYGWCYGVQIHSPGPGLIEPCEFHAWKSLTLARRDGHPTVACRCKCQEVTR